jgi:hypothetical protein
MQEFYECPNDKFRGKYFTLDEFMDWYASQNPDGIFSYFEDWAGFNIPGKYIIQFWNTFVADGGVLRDKEYELFNVIKDFVFNDDPNFCIIGTFSYNERIFSHELRHAYYYLNKNYRKQCDDIFNELPDSIKKSCYLSLLDMGYHHDMIPDEIQAYFGTETVDSIVNMFNLTECPLHWVNKYHNITV